MKRTVLLLIALCALLATGCQETYSGRLILSGDHEFAADEVVEGEVVITGGRIRVAQGARVTGSVYMLSGILHVDGEVAGDVSAVGGRLTVGPRASIGGDVNSAGAPEVAPEARIGGELRVGPSFEEALRIAFTTPSVERQLIQLLPESLVMGLLAFLAVRFLPRPVSRVRNAAGRHAIVAGAMGILAGLVAPALLVAMAFTIILIPLTMVGLVLGGLTIAYGWVAAGWAVGRRLASALKRDYSQPVQAFLGTFALTAVVGLVGLLPLVGGLGGLLVAVVGLGAVLLTRFGYSEFTPASDTAAFD
jgi:hypothetical protein